MAYILTLMRESVALKNHFYPIKAVLRRSGQSLNLVNNIFFPDSQFVIDELVLKSLGTNV